MGSGIRVAVDVVLLTVRAGRLLVLLVQRGVAPFRGSWALPGGFVLPGEDLEQAAYRELAEEAGLGAEDVTLEQLRSYGDPDRDPSGRVVSVAWLALGADLPDPAAGSDAADARWTPVADALAAGLAYDHAQILRDGVERAGAKLEYSTLATAFVPDEFTVAELREVYRAVWGVYPDVRNFHRKVTGAHGFLLPTGRTTTRGGGRPARTFRAGPATMLWPPILRGGSR